MENRNTISLVIILIGFVVFLIRINIILYFISFIFLIIGFLIVLIIWCLILWISEFNIFHTPKRTHSSGLPGICNYIDERILSIPSYNPTGVELLDNVIEHLILLILRDFVLQWHDPYFHDTKFPQLILMNMHLLVNQLSTRIRAVSWTQLCALQLNAIVTLHVKIFIKSLKTLDEKEHIYKNHAKITNEFFNLETHMSNILPHKSICTDYNKEIEYLTFLVESLMYFLLPDMHFNEKILRYFVRDVVVTRVILPMINTICDPDYINQIIHSYKTDVNYNNEFFNYAIRITNSIFDLRELIGAIKLEIARLSVYDMREKELEEMTKKQISSLLFIERMSSNQMESPRERRNSSTTSKHLSSSTKINMTSLCKIDYNLPQSKIEEIPFRELFENNDTFPYLVDYFQEIGDDNLFFLYFGIKDVIEKFETFISSDSYIKKTISYNDVNVVNLRNDILSLINTYEKQFTTKNIKFDYIDKFNVIHKQAAEPIPSVSMLMELQRLILDYFQEPQYLKALYSSAKYAKLLAEILPKSTNNEQIYDRHDVLQLMKDMFGTNFSLHLFISDTVLCGPFGAEYFMYVVHVVAKIDNVQYSWNVHRRFRHFAEFHDNLVYKFPPLSSIPFPEKRIIGNKHSEIVEKRKVYLDAFLNNLISHEQFRVNQPYFSMVVAFLDGENSYDSEKQAESYRLRDTVSVDIHDTTIENDIDLALSRSHTSNLDNEDSESLAMSLLVTLIEDLFDIRQKTPWITRQIKVVVKNLIILTVRDKVIRKFIDGLEYYFTAEAFTVYLNHIRQTFWPNNTWAAPHPHRSNEIRARERIIATTILIGSLPSELRRFLGEDVSLDGIHKLFNMLQIQSLNKRLFYTILEAVIEALFPDNTYGDIFKNLRENSTKSR